MALYKCCTSLHAFRTLLQEFPQPLIQNRSTAEREAQWLLP